jgi:hypothetical protein
LPEGLIQKFGGHHKMGACSCGICARGRRISEAVNDRDVDVLIDIVEDLEAELADAELSNDYYKSIFDGSWPDACSILEDSLNKIKLKLNKEGPCET